MSHVPSTSGFAPAGPEQEAAPTGEPRRATRLLVDEVSKSFWLRRTGRLKQIVALDGISFSARAGEIVGLIGSRRSGKTSLLRIVSGLSMPTSGRVLGRGRLVPLLELASLYQPDRTGIESLFIAGELAKVPPEVTAGRIDEVFEFAGIERFRDVAIKRYSAGMYLRFAFSAAVSQEPDIFVADDVFGVGDLEFQERALHRIQELANGGTTVLLASRSSAVLSRLCSRVVWLENGKVVADGDAGELLGEFADSLNVVTGSDDTDAFYWSREENFYARFESVDLVSSEGAVVRSVRRDEPARIRIVFDTRKADLTLRPVLELYAGGNMVLRAGPAVPLSVPREGRYSLTAVIPAGLLNCLYYLTRVELTFDPRAKTIGSSQLRFAVRAGDSPRSDNQDMLPFHGLVAPGLEWQVTRS